MTPTSTSSFVEDLTIQLGTVRPGHGIKFKIRLESNWAASAGIHAGPLGEWLLDISAPSQFWSNFGPGVAQLAEFLLPLKCWPEVVYHSATDEMEFSFTLGAKQLSHERIFRELANQAAHGDPAICLKIFRYQSAPEEALVLILKCSSLRFVDGIARDVADRSQYPAHTFAPRAGWLGGLLKTIRFASWVVGPAAWVASCWATFTSLPFRARFLTALPSWTQLYWRKHASTLYDILPVRPLNMLAAFRLGNIYEQVKAGGDISQLLQEAGELVKRDQAGPLTLEQLQALPKTLADLAAEVGPVQRALGLLSFVNLVWFVAILVIAVSVVPAIYYTIRPLSALLRRLSYWLWRNIIKPTAIRCHEWSVFEVLAWSLTLVTLADSYRVPASVQLYIQLTAAVFSILASSYSTVLHGLTFIKPLSQRAQAVLGSLFAASFFAPLALASESQLLGFATVASIYSALGFGVRVSHLCWMIGFENQEQLLRVATCSAALLSSYWLFVPRLLQHSPLAETVHNTFGAAIGIYGSVAMHTALLIFSADPVRMFSLSYLKRNSITIGALVATSLVGNMWLPSSGMATTAVVFGSLYATQKYAELHTRNKWNGWLLALVSGLVLYRGAIAVHTNPDLLLSLVRA